MTDANKPSTDLTAANQAIAAIAAKSATVKPATASTTVPAKTPAAKKAPSPELKAALDKQQSTARVASPSAKKVAAPAPTAAAKKAATVLTADQLSKSTFIIDPKAVVRKEGFNPRIEFGDIDDLARSIKANGQLQPIRVKKLGDGKFELIDGDRRLTAIESIIKTDSKAFAAGIEAKIVDADQSDIDSLFQMFESNSGKSFLPVEEANAYGRMRAAGLTIAQIGERVGRGPMHIQSGLALYDAVPEVKEAVATGAVGKSLGKHIAYTAKGDAEAQKTLIAAAKKAGKNKVAIKQVQQQVEAVRKTRAANAGRVLKIRALTDDQLSAIGAKVSENLMGEMERLELVADADLMEWVRAGAGDLKVAFMFGMLQGLKAAAGQVVPLTLD